jgi:hypothetical protein
MPQKSMTHRMVRDLVNGPLPSAGGRGLMILIRQPGNTGRAIFDKIMEARNARGLQERFAVLIDVGEGTNGKSGPEVDLRTVMKKHNPLQFVVPSRLRERIVNSSPSKSR